MKKAFYIIGVYILLSCTKARVNNSASIKAPDSIPNTPSCIVYLQPYNQFSSKETEAIIPKLREKFDYYLGGTWDFQILPIIKLPSNTYIKSLNRYSAVSILDYEKKNRKKETVIIGLTHEDICANVHGKSNYGIIGLSSLSERVCIVSDKRLIDKRDLWKPVMHEFMHAFFGLKHCQEDNDSCIMQDGKGKGDFTNKNIICKSCFN